MEEVLRIGSVISVKGRQVEVQVDKTKNTPHLLYNGEVLNNVSVGSYIKICKGFESIIGKIDGEYIVSRFTIPLSYNGTMSISATKIADRIL
mgnify:CR=1 FL=1